MRGLFVFLLFVLVAGFSFFVVFLIVDSVYASVERDFVVPVATFSSVLSDDDAAVLRGIVKGFSFLQRQRFADAVRFGLGFVLFEFFLVIAGVMVYVRRVRRPIRALAGLMEGFVRDGAGALSHVRGGQDVSYLVRAYEGFLRRLDEYESVVGDLSRFRGWKEISRVIVHEVRNVLSPVRMVVEHAVSTGVFPAERGVFVLRKLGEVDGLLDRFRRISHLPEACVESVKLSDVVRDVVCEFFSVAVDCPESCVAMADSLLLAEVIRNLLKNVRDMGEDVECGVVCYCEGDYCVVCVWDRGSGVEPDVLDKIWSPGFSTKTGGLGIGLPLVKSLVAEMGGWVECESQPGEGFVVRVFLKRGI
ncbi:HAMP domain-containing sensor histidine kinase [Spirochaetia bacterium 38H-sp]|uniref:histidine kinase n=1 Tax=Rarispira pelagica TaxID=3141764 RepID=A0ABU9UAF9_9SPIR